jgi:hypothetical protein
MDDMDTAGKESGQCGDGMPVHLVQLVHWVHNTPGNR